jgi:hypothetical protein
MIARERREGGEAAGRGGNRAAARPRGGSGRKKKGRGRGEADRWAQASAAQGKKGEGEGGPAREAGWAAWAEKEPVQISLFFLFFFNFIFKSFFHLKFNSNFSQEFYKLFRNFTSNRKPCKPTDDAHTLVVSNFIKLYLIFYSSI